MKLSIEQARLAGQMKNGSRRERIFARAELEGLAGMDGAEKIEFFLYRCAPKKGLDVQALAARMDALFGGLGALAADEKTLLQAEGMYPALAKRFFLQGEMMRALCRWEAEYVYTRISTVAAAKAHALGLYRECEKPSTWQLNLNEAGDLIFEGEIIPSLEWQGADFVENSLEDAQLCRAKRVILVQMCGRMRAVLRPYDKKHAALQAKRLAAEGCELADVLLLDDEGRAVSMYEKGVLHPEGDGKTYFEDREEKLVIYRMGGRI